MASLHHVSHGLRLSLLWNASGTWVERRIGNLAPISGSRTGLFLPFLPLSALSHSARQRLPDKSIAGTLCLLKQSANFIYHIVYA